MVQACPRPAPPEDQSPESYWQRRAVPVLAAMAHTDRWLVLVGALLAACAEIGTRYSLNVILPDMQGNVAASQDELSWVVTVYSSGYIAGIALSAGLVRYLGGRNYLVLTFACYTAGSVGCWASHDLWHLLVARVLMGLGGGPLVLRAQVLTYQMFAGDQRSIPNVLFGLSVHGSRAVYPLVVAYITETWGWNGGFLVCIPIMAVATLLVVGFLPRHVAPDRDHPPDTVGIFLVLAGLAALQIAAARGDRNEWLDSPMIVCLLFVALMCLLLFLWWSSHPDHSNPMLHLRSLFSLPSLPAALVVAVCVGALMGSSLYILPQYLRFVQSYGAFQAAGFYFVDGLGTLVALLAGTYILKPRLGAPGMLALGFVTMALFAWIFIGVLTPTTPTCVLAPVVFVRGLAFGWMLSGMSTLALGSLDAPYLSEGDAAYRVVRQVGSILGVTGAEILLDWRMTLHSSRLLDESNRLNPVTQSALKEYARLASSHSVPADPGSSALAIFQANVVKQAALLTFMDIFWCVFWLALASIVVLYVAAPAIRTLRLFLHDD